MSAEPGSDQDLPKRRGRIPQSAWPGILERHRAGDTLSAIAREFDCTPSAISYIVRKAEANLPDSVVADEPKPVAPPPRPALTSPSIQPGTLRIGRLGESRTADTRLNEAKLNESKAVMATGNVTQVPAWSATPAAAAAPAAAQAATPAAAETDSRAPRVAHPEPAPPVDAVEGRLRETARKCLSAYRGWRQSPTEVSVQTLSDTVHDLRKALARIEIDLSASRRDEQAARPIPIPQHRAARPQR
ncbi:MAG: hypothetical protein GC191_11070 [Azospirillum sp.]|nr:hypothetical protein [Azospirillum sp.]